jgi:mono/diheme cytochrome c family protein
MRRCIAIVTIWAFAGCRNSCGVWDASLERMVDQPKYKAYSVSDFYGDGRAMRAPPAGAVAVDAELEAGGAAASGGSAAGSAVQFTSALVERGRERFDIFCAPCHGIAGDGDSVVAGKMQLRRPPSLGEERLRRLSDLQLYRVVVEGYGLMPSYRQQLSVSERWAVVAYVRALQMSLGVPIVALPEAVREEALRALK